MKAKNAGFLKLRYTYRNIFSILAVWTKLHTLVWFFCQHAFECAKQMCYTAPPNLRKCLISQNNWKQRCALFWYWIWNSMRRGSIVFKDKSTRPAQIYFVFQQIFHSKKERYWNLFLNDAGWKHLHNTI